MVRSEKAASLFAFLFFALSLCVPSGYSWGSGALALLAIVTWRSWRKRLVISSSLSALVVIFVWMALIWGSSFDTGAWKTHNDYLLKYILAVLALCCAVGLGISGRSVIWGVVVGALGAAVVAGHQVFFLHLDRAHGFTNAIQFGGIALFLGFSCFVIAMCLRHEWGGWKTTGVLLGGILGLMASLLSEARGAWLAIPFILLLLAWARYRMHGSQVLWKEGGAALMLITAVAVIGHEKIATRVGAAVQETRAYFEHGVTETSVGQRWDHWALAWNMGLDAPWTGWGERGYQVEKQKRVERGEAAAFTGSFGHAHNEMLDMFARRGLVGLAGLLAFYLVPFFVFARQIEAHSESAALRNCLASLGMMLPVCYFFFGLTQVFFAHNSGHIFYLFSIISLYAATRRV